LRTRPVPRAAVPRAAVPRAAVSRAAVSRAAPTRREPFRRANLAYTCKEFGRFTNRDFLGKDAKLGPVLPARERRSYS